MRRPNFIASQAGCPSGLLGRFLAWIMSFETRTANQKTLDLLQIQNSDTILEIGFGHGRTIQSAAGIAAEGFVAGVESSSLAIEIAGKHNGRKIQKGQVELRLMADMHIPYADCRFDKAYSVHSIYFWLDANRMLREVYRVLKPAGVSVLCFRDDPVFRKSFPPEVYRFRTTAEVRDLLSDAGFHDVQMVSEKSHAGELHWAIARKQKKE